MMAELPEENGNGASARTGPVLIRDQYLIDVDAPIQELNTPSAKAYSVLDRRNQEIELFALICTPGLPTRVKVMREMRGDRVTGILPMVDWDTVFWPPMNQETMAVIYERPLGGSVLSAITKGEYSVTEYDLQGLFIEPIYRGIRDLARRGIPHRGIRLENMFFMDVDRTEVVVGDCATCPPGFDQPVLYETIERAMASPAGRGTGSLGDDLYALGVFLATTMSKNKQLAKLTDDEIIISKIEKSTYSTICGDARMPVPILEPLRGMLSDNPGDRWDTDEMNLWLDGKRQTPQQRKPAKRTDTPFEFDGREYRNIRSLAFAFTRNIKEAAKAIRGEDLEPWIRRKIENPELADEVKTAAERIKLKEKNGGSKKNNDEFLVSKVSILMDPASAIRYKDFAFIPEGFGPAFAVEFLRKQNLKIPIEVVKKGLPEIWYNALSDQPRDALSYACESAFGKMKAYLKIESPGFGVERCLYEFNLTLPCMSPFIAEQYVLTIRELLPALDEVADQVDTKKHPLDRHIAAFIATRFKEPIEPHLRSLASTNDATYIIGMLSLLAFLQWKQKTPPVFALASWIGGLLGPAINTYFSRETRKQIEQEMPKVVRQGMLPELFDLIDNPEKRRLDNEGYAQARMDFLTAENEIQEIETGDLSSAESAIKVGQKFAAMTSVVISMIVISVLFLFETW